MSNSHPAIPAGSSPLAQRTSTSPTTPTASRVRLVLSRDHGRRFNRAPAPTRQDGASPTLPRPPSTPPATTPRPASTGDGPPLLRSPHARASHDIPEADLPPWLLETTRQLNPAARAATPTTGDVRTTHADRRARRIDTGALDLRDLPPTGPATHLEATPRRPRHRTRRLQLLPPGRTHGEWMLFTAGEALPYSCTVTVVVLLAHLLGLFG